jgi:hypothetical protein
MTEFPNCATDCTTLNALLLKQSYSGVAFKMSRVLVDLKSQLLVA